MEELLASLALSAKGKEYKLYAGLAAAVLVIAILAFVIYKTVKAKQALSDEKHNKELAKEADQEINTNNITLTQMQFNSFASKLYNAMDGPGTHTEEDIYDVFEQLQTRSDVLQLIKTFGIRDGENLSEWLHGDLNNKEINRVNQILTNNGINYMF